MSERWRVWQGQTVGGKYRLMQHLGTSPSSDVFLTESGDTVPRKRVIKLIAENPATAPMQLARWEMASKLSHPHLVGISDFGRCDLGDARMLYVVTDYAEENLGQILPQRPLTSDEAKQMLNPVLEALAFLHKEDLVHGHLKPSNIMVVGEQLKISSDGISPKGGPNAERREKTLYDAPESANAGRSAASDVWAVAVVMVEALTQLPPVSQGTDEPILPTDLKEPFREIARHCLSPDPGRRWTIDAIAEHLKTPQAATPVVVQPRPAPTAVAAAEVREAASPQDSGHQLLGKWRFRLIAMAAGALLVVLLAGKMFEHRQTEPTTASTATTASTGVNPPAAQTTAPAPGVAVKAPASESSTPPPPAAHATKSKTPPPVATGTVVEQVLPTIPKSARNTIEGHIRIGVRVSVDGSGNVINTKLVSPGPSQYFARLTNEAARKWKFKPAEAGDPSTREWLLKFEITRKATSVNPVPASR